MLPDISANFNNNLMNEGWWNLFFSEPIFRHFENIFAKFRVEVPLLKGEPWRRKTRSLRIRLVICNFWIPPKVININNDIFETRKLVADYFLIRMQSLRGKYGLMISLWIPVSRTW